MFSFVILYVGFLFVCLTVYFDHLACVHWRACSAISLKILSSFTLLRAQGRCYVKESEINMLMLCHVQRLCAEALL